MLMLIICISQTATGHELPPTRTLDVEDGLPQSFISDMAQDANGFIWIGTRGGLARYDGHNIKTYLHIPGDSTTLADNVITNLYMDSRQCLWICYGQGDIDVLHTETEHLYHFTKEAVYHTLTGNFASGNSIAEDANGNMWIRKGCTGLYYCNLIEHSLAFYTPEALGIPDQWITGLSSDRRCILVVTDTTISWIGPGRKAVEIVSLNFPQPHLYSFRRPWKDMNLLVRRHTGELVLLDEERIIVYQPFHRNFLIYPLPHRELYINPSMTEDEAGNIYFGFKKTIYKLSVNNTLSVWREEDSLYKEAISMLYDESGVFWIGGNATGMQAYDLRLTHMTGRVYRENFVADVFRDVLQVPHAELKTSFLADMNPYRLRSAIEKNGRLWITQSGKDILRTPNLAYYQNGHLMQPAWHYTDTAATHQQINALAFNRSGELWGIDYQLQPVHIDTHTNTITVFPSNLHKLVDSVIGNVINTLVMDGNDTCWIATVKLGLIRYIRHTNEVRQYRYDKHMPAAELTCMLNDITNPDILWIGTLGGGIIKFSKQNGVRRVYATPQGLPNNTVYALLQDHNGLLWCSSNKGIFSFQPITGQTNSFTEKDGLPGNEFNRFHFLQHPDGHLIFGGLKGYTIFDPLQITIDHYEPPVMLTGIQINNKPADFGDPGSPLEQGLNSLKKLVLPYNRNFLSFTFSAPEYNIPDKLNYRYKLSGLDDEWVHAGTQNTATYTNLSPGTYTLMINAQNTARIWSRKIKILKIIILPPFWLSWWFLTLMALILASGIYLAIRLRILSIQRKAQEQMDFERATMELEAGALRAQMNPHFIFNCLNSIKYLIQDKNDRAAVSYLTTFSKLIRTQLNNTPREISLYEELETCRLYTKMEALRFQDKVHCEFVILADTHSIMVPPLLVQPFIENAIWHGILPRQSGGEVTISVVREPGAIVCRIEDNGIGRAASMACKPQLHIHDSKGMLLAEKRLELHNMLHQRSVVMEITDKTDQAGKATGTLVMLQFKI